MEQNNLAILPQHRTGGMSAVAESREAQSVQAAMVVAQRFPRDTTRSLTRVLDDCKRKGLAEKAVYRYVRGGTEVTGPSIRLAEAMARAWGNIDCGITELERKPAMGNFPGESVIQAYSWDLETNTRITKIFTVKHWRDTKKGGYALTEERDIYELIANQGARRLRACILAAIPADIIEEALDQCTKTMQGGQGPIIDRIRLMVTYFKDTFQVTQEMIEKRIGHKVDAISEQQLAQLKQIANSLKDGMAKREDFFETSDSEAGTQVAEEKNETKQPAKTIKNFAPQTPDEAKNMKAGDGSPEGKTNEQHAEDADAKAYENARADAVKAIIVEQKRLKWSQEQLNKSIESEFNKPASELTIEDMKIVADMMKGMKS